MNTQQIVLAICAIAVPSIIPTVAVVISILRSESRHDKLDAKIDAKSDSIRNEMQADRRILENIAYEHHGRITKLEGRP